ncbi:MAG: hypothetical protein L0216_22035 [Planctomycetales bacterium]|nr:hypothetical protein [Planctomycetales bacterium]
MASHRRATSQGRSGELRLYLYGDGGPKLPDSATPRAVWDGKGFRAVATLLPDGHAVRVEAGHRVLVEHVGTAPLDGKPAAATLDLGDTPEGGLFYNDRLLYRSDHTWRTFDSPEALARAAEEARRELTSSGLTVVERPARGDGAPWVGIRGGPHELEVRAVYRVQEKLGLLLVHSRLGLKLKMRR